MMKTEAFILQSQKRTSPVLLAVFILALAGCSSSGNSLLAPKPPTYDMASAPREPITLVEIGNSSQTSSQAGVQSALTANSLAPDCKLKQRFDREDALAYEWGTNGRNRLGVSISGMQLDNMGLDKVGVKYSLRLQPESTKKQRCRYASQWQGLLGSTYNELYLRKHNTVWSALRDYQDEAEDGLSDLFD